MKISQRSGFRARRPLAPTNGLPERRSIPPHLLSALVMLSFFCGQGVSAQVTKSSPAADATLTKPARELRVWFGATPDPDKSSLKVSGPEGALQVTGIHTMGEDDLMARISGRMPDGSYTVSWMMTDSSGVASNGTWSFEVRREGSTPAKTDEPDRPMQLGIVLYPGWEPLDVFGPLEMFMNVGVENLRIHMLAEEAGLVPSSAGAYPESLAPKVMADIALKDAPKLDIILVPGGFGTFAALDSQPLLDWLKERSQETQYMASVCTGSAILAKAGVLDGKKATGNKLFFSWVAAQGDKTEWIKEARWVDDGRVITSSGVSAGIDMALGIIANLFGEQSADMIAASTEYDWKKDPTEDPFSRYLDMGMAGIDALEQAHTSNSP